MTLDRAIDKLDEYKPNTYSREEKIEWLNELDQKLNIELFCRYEQEQGEEQREKGNILYDEQTDGATELLVKDPFTNIYFYWCEAKIDYANGEYGKYSNSITMFNNEYEQLRDDYNRNHKVIRAKTRYL